MTGGYDEPQLWLTRLVERHRNRLGGPRKAATLLFGGPVVAALTIYLAVRWNAIPVGFLYSVASLAVVGCVAPSLVWYYDRELYPAFLREFAELTDESAMRRIGRRHRETLARRWPVAAALAVLPIPVLVTVGGSYLRTRGLFGPTDPVFLLVAATLVWLGVLVGLGFLLVAVTLSTVRHVVREEIAIDPLHPDGLGGVSAVGRLSIRTTTLFSVGALLLPTLFDFAAGVGPTATAVVYLMTAAYTVAIVVSFVYPTVVVYRRADEIRATVLDDLREQYRTVKREAGEPVVGADTERTDAAAEAKLRRVRREYEDYRTVSLYPFEPTVIARLVGSVLLPLVFLVVDTVLRPATVGRIVAWLT
ncbi:MAG: hypothetical protein ABEI99_07900 [Halobaculum sp.]